MKLRNPITIAACVCAVAIAGMSSSWGATRALLVGIDEYPDPVPSLRGCVNDVNRFKSVLTNTYGVSSSSIRTVTNRAATRAGIMAAFESHLINGVKAEDTVIFYFSGHGSNTPDLNGDESDGEDEALCPHDIDPTRPDTWLTDDVIRHLLSRVPTANVLVILDCCHSGTGTRADPPEFSETRGLPMGFFGNRKKKKAPKREEARFFSRIRTSPKHYVLAASGAGQLANEISASRFKNLGMSEKQSSGVLTYALCEVLTSNPNITFGDMRKATDRRVDELVTKLRRISRNASKQDAQFEIPSSSTKFASFVQSNVGSAPVKAPTTKARGIEVNFIPEGSAIPAQVTNSGVVTTGDIKLNLSTNQRIFRKGDNLVVSVSADRDCYLRLYYKNAEGDVLQIFPNKGKKTNFITKNANVQIPSSGDGFRFTMGAPYGSEILKAVASTSQFTDLHTEGWASTLFESVKEDRIDRLSTRGAAKAPTTKFGEATLIYEVWEK